MAIILSFEVMLPEFPIKHQYMSVARLKKLTLKTIVLKSIILKETKSIFETSLRDHPIFFGFRHNFIL